MKRIIEAELRLKFIERDGALLNVGTCLPITIDGQEMNACVRAWEIDTGLGPKIYTVHMMAFSRSKVKR